MSGCLILRALFVAYCSCSCLTHGWVSPSSSSSSSWKSRTRSIALLADVNSDYGNIATPDIHNDFRSNSRQKAIKNDKAPFEYKPANAWAAFTESFDMFFPLSEKYGALHDMFLEKSGGVWKAKAFGLFGFYGVSAVAPGLTKDLIQADAQGLLQNSWAFRLDEILGENTFTIVADRHDQLYLEARKVYVEQLSTQSILANEATLQGLEQEVNSVMMNWQTQITDLNEPILFAEGVGNMTFGFVLHTLLGYRGSEPGQTEALFTDEQAATIHQAVRTVNAGLFCPPVNNWFIRQIPYFNRYAKGLEARQTITDMVTVAVERRVEALADGAPASCMLDALIHADLPQDQITPFAVENMVLSFLAGYETTTSLLSNAALILADDLAAQDALRQELNNFDIRDHRLHSKKGLFSRLPTLESVMSESFRYRPVANGHFRQAVEDVSVGDVVIPKGSTITWLMSPGARSTKLYSEPTKACPLRFLNKHHSSSKEQGGKDDTSTGSESETPEPLPELFGYGKHICPGRYLAQVQMALLMKEFLGRFDFTLVPGQDLSPNMPNMVPKSGLVMKLELRNSNVGI